VIKKLIAQQAMFDPVQADGWSAVIDHT